MKIRDIFDESLIIQELNGHTKHEAIQEMVDRLDSTGKLVNKEAYHQAVLNREAKYSTGIGMGVAIPHGKSSGVRETALVFARSSDGIDFDSMDGKPVHLLFMIAVPDEVSDDHLKILGTISSMLMHQNIRNDLMEATSFEEVNDVLGNK